MRRVPEDGHTHRCGVHRRDFLRFVGAGALASLAADFPVMAGPFQPEDFARLVPPD